MKLNELKNEIKNILNEEIIITSGHISKYVDLIAKAIGSKKGGRIYRFDDYTSALVFEDRALSLLIKGSSGNDNMYVVGYSTNVKDTNNYAKIPDNINGFKKLSNLIELPMGKTFHYSDFRTPKLSTITPKSREELIDIIENEIEENGLNADLNFIDVSKIKDFTYIFNYMDSATRGKFNGKISAWDVSGAETMMSMFVGSKFSGDISNWKPINVWNFENFAFNAKNFKSDLRKWKIKRSARTVRMLSNTETEAKGLYPKEWQQ